MHRWVRPAVADRYTSTINCRPGNSRKHRAQTRANLDLNDRNLDQRLADGETASRMDEAPPPAVAAAEAAAGVPLVRCAASIVKGPTAKRIGIKMRHTCGEPVIVSHVARVGPASRPRRPSRIVS